MGGAKHSGVVQNWQITKIITSTFLHAKIKRQNKTPMILTFTI